MKRYLMATLAALTVFVGVCLWVGNSYALTTTNASCPGAHYTDFQEQAKKKLNASYEQTFESDFKKVNDYFSLHITATQAPADITSLSPYFYLIVMPPMATVSDPQAKGLIVYFDAKGCYIAKANMPWRLFKALGSAMQRSHV